MIKEMVKAFSRQGTNIKTVSQLIPAAIKQKRALNRSGNILGFSKEDGLWYADLKHWPLDKHHLLMVQGADTLLDELNDGSNYVTLRLKASRKRVEVGDNEILLERYDTNGISGSYNILGEFNTKQLWLCPVVNFVFKRVPEYIVFELINE